jgi:hypothetical protein
LNVTPVLQKSNFHAPGVPESGNYRISLYFGKTDSGAKIWLDDIELVPVK